MILLIQFRTDQSGWHEIKCVYEACGVPHHYYSVVNAVNNRVSSEDILKLAKQSQLVLLGGVGEGGYEADSGQAKVNFQTARDKMKAIIPKLADLKIPMLGMCFGHQVLADALGGSVEKNNEQAETGVAEICLTEAGKSDPLLANMDSCFPAVVGHKASVTKLPEQATHLAESKQSPLQSFRYQDNIYGFQFHPELNRSTLEDRLEMYPDYRANSIGNDSNQPIVANQIMKQAIEVFVE